MPPLAKKSLREAVDSLRNLSPRLNAITDLANETVRDVETFLNDECSIGVPAYTCFNGNSEDPAGDYLAYVRVGPRYRIAIVECNQVGEDISMKPWADSPRSVKLTAFKALPDLLTEIAERVEAQLSETEKAAKKVAATLADIRKPAQPERR